MQLPRYVRRRTDAAATLIDDAGPCARQANEVPPIGDNASMTLWRHIKTGRLCWTELTLDPQRYAHMPIVAEDDLPTEMPESEYASWLQDSMVIHGERFGPAH